MKLLISDAGPAGLTVGLLARRYGFNPTIVERAPPPLLGGYKIDVRGTALQILGRLGVVLWTLAYRAGDGAAERDLLCVTNGSEAAN